MNMGGVQEVSPIDRGFVAPDMDNTHHDWLNGDREKAFDVMSAEIRRLKQGAANGGEVLLGILKNASSPAFGYEARFRGRLSPEDMQHILCQEADTVLASDIAGVPVERLVFVVEDDVVYSKLQEALHLRPGAAHGFNLPGLVFTDRPEWKNATLLITQDRPVTIQHEIQHTIDPISERHGYDRMIEEVFAFVANFRSAKGVDWQQLANSVAHTEYFKKYSQGLGENERISEAAWKQRVAMAVVATRDIVGLVGEIPALRSLAKMNSVDELLLEWKHLQPPTTSSAT